MTLPERLESPPPTTDKQSFGGSSASDRSFWTDPLIWFLLLLAVIIRIVYNLALKQDPLDWYSFVIDEREYFGAAHMFAEGRGFSFFDTALWVRPPLYVVLLGILLRLGQDTYLPVLVIQSVLSAATLLPLGLLAYHHGGRAAARWCVAFGTLYLPFTLFAGLLLSETVFLFFLAWVLLALYKAASELTIALRRSGLVWLGVAGIMLGMAALTRATALGFVPLAALWLFIILRRGAHITTKKALLLAGVLLVVPILMLIPWTARNWAVYGRFIPVDTTTGYNLWLGSVGVRDEPRLQADLLRIENQGDRQAFALARGWENISSDPVSFLGKGAKESLDLWRPLFGAEERQVRGYASGRVPAWHLASLFVFDDLLYLLVLLAASMGLLFLAAAPMRFLTVLWLIMWLATAFIFFAVTRFRLPIVAALLPWAGIGIAHFSSLTRARRVLARSNNGQRIGLAVSFALVAIVVLPAIPLEDTVLGVQRWEAQAPYRRGEALLADGRTSAAIAEYNLASSEIPDTRYALAAAYLQEGNIASALGQLAVNEPERRFEPLLIRGEAARRSGDLATARSFFNERTVNLAGDEALRWAWDHLSPPPVKSIDLGSGLDIGYVKGFHSSEVDGGRQFRWSSNQMEVRGLQMSGSADVTVEMSGWRPDILPAAQFSIYSPLTKEQAIGGRIVITLPNDAAWTSEKVGVDTGIDDSGPIFDFRASVNPFIGSGSDPRLLGVRITRINVAP